MGNCFGSESSEERSIHYKDNNYIKELGEINPELVPFFTFENKTIYVKVVDAYDGDTCTIIFKYNNEYVKYKLRMYGYNSPEMRPRLNLPNRVEIKRLAKIAKEKLRSLVLNKIVKIEFTEEEKYGRLMGTMFLDNININKLMVDEGYGKPYFGGKK